MRGDEARAGEKEKGAGAPFYVVGGSVYLRKVVWGWDNGLSARD